MEANEDWEARYLAGETPWEKGGASPPLAEYLARSEALRPAGRVLVPGCGLGHDVRLLAALPGVEALGLDIAPTALERARSFRPAGAEAYRLGDLFDLDEDLVGAFDWVFEHTCLSALDPATRPAYARALHAALRPGGHLLGVFFVRIEDPELPPFPISPAELDALFEPGFEVQARWEPKAAYPGREGREEMRLLRRREPCAG